MTYSLSNNCTKNYYNRTLTVQVIVEDVVTWIFLKHSVVVVVVVDVLPLHPGPLHSYRDFVFLASEDAAHSNSFGNFCTSVSFKRIQIFNQNTESSLSGMFTDMAVTRESSSFLLP